MSGGKRRNVRHQKPEISQSEAAKVGPAAAGRPTPPMSLLAPKQRSESITNAPTGTRPWLVRCTFPYRGDASRLIVGMSFEHEMMQA